MTFVTALHGMSKDDSTTKGRSYKHVISEHQYTNRDISSLKGQCNGMKLFKVCYDLAVKS